MTGPRAIEFLGAEGNRLKGNIWDGHGRPVLFLHGGGQTRRAWDWTAKRVAAVGMRAITVDQRGHGESDWVPSSNYAFAHFAEDVAAVVRQATDLFHAAPSVVGASLGGLAALAAEIRQGPLHNALILVDVIPRMDREGIARIQGFMGERRDEGFASMEEAADAIARYLPHRQRPASFDGLKKNLRRTADGRYFWHWDPAFMTSERNIGHNAVELMEELTAALPGLAPPVLLVRGVQSELVHEAHAREFVSLVPGASYVDVGGAGHMVAGDKNDIFSSAILDFLTEHKAISPA